MITADVVMMYHLTFLFLYTILKTQLASFFHVSQSILDEQIVQYDSFTRFTSNGSWINSRLQVPLKGYKINADWLTVTINLVLLG